MRNLRYLLRLIAAFLSRFKVLIGIGVVFGILIFFVIGIIFPKVGGWQTHRVGIAGRYTINSLPKSILSQIGSGLTQLDSSGRVLPDLAESWSTPDDGKTWIFQLKPEIYWQDGTPVISRDLEYRFSDAEISYPDDRTISFGLQNPYSAFPAVVATPVFKGGLLGTGEWEVKNLSLVSDLVNRLTLENKTKERTIYKFYPTEESVKLAFELGEVDVAMDLLNPEPLDSWEKTKVTKTTNKGEYVALFFDTTDQFLADKTLRQALSYATNKANLDGERAISPIPDTSWAFNPQVKPYTYDPEKAKTMIDGMGDVKNELNITLTTSPILLPLAEQIQKDWEAVGIKCTVQVFSNIPSTYQAMLAIFDAPDDPDQYSIWHSTQTQTNITHFTSPRIDKLLEDGRTRLEQAQRKSIYLDFQRFLLEDAPAMFLYYPTVYRIER